MMLAVTPLRTRRDEALESESVTNPPGPMPPNTPALSAELNVALAVKVSVFANWVAFSDWDAATPAFCVPAQVVGTRLSSASAKARQLEVTLSRVRKPVPTPPTLASPRMSMRTDIVVVPLAPAPCPPMKFGVAIVRLATPAADAAPLMPVTTSAPWPLAVFNAPKASVSGFAALGVSSIRPAPLSTLNVVIVSVVAAREEPLRSRRPPWMPSDPMTSRPRRLFTFAAPELSKDSTPPALSRKEEAPLAAVPLKASPEST